MNGISKLVVKKGLGLAKSQAPKIFDLAYKTGVDLVTGAIPDYCVPKDELDKILDQRNKIMDQINLVSIAIDKLASITDVLKPAVLTVEIAIQTSKLAEEALVAILTAWPEGTPIPGKLISGLFILDGINQNFPPKLTKIVNKLTAIVLAVSFAKNILLKIKNLLSSIDNYLKGCGVNANNLTPLNEGLQQFKNTLLDNINNGGDNLYKGFILDIVEEQFTPTVKRRRAVAKNINGIILLQTPLTFATDTQTLINEIKLVIDSSDLKAN